MDRILRLSPIPTIILDPSWTIAQVSRGFCDVTGLIDSDCIGRPLSELLGTQLPFVDADAVQLEIQRAVINRRPCTTEEVQSIDDTFWRTRVVPIYETSEKLIYIQLEFEDVTADCNKLQSLNDELVKADIYRLLVNTVKDYAIFLLDPTGHIATWNTGASLLKQYKAEEVIGRHFSMFYGDEDNAAQIPEMELEVATHAGKFEDSGWRYRKDGSRFWANVLITPSYRDNILIGFTKVTRDMTERHAAEARLVAEYEDAAKLKTQFLANMSHEIRSPMHGMLSAITLLSEMDLNPEQKELATIIEDSGSILLQVINDILDYSKLSSGAFQLNSIDMSIKDTILAVIRSTETSLKPGLQLQYMIDRNVPDLVNGDPLRFRQVLQNIVVNAVKFTEVGSVDVDVRVTAKDGTTFQILTEITDTGVGIPPQAAEQLFTPFTQLDNSATKKFKGTGLGLSICKSLVELMGGDIGFKRNPSGIGSTFWFQVPMKRSHLLSRNPSVTPTLSIVKAITKRRILLVEDNPVNQNVMVKTLSRLGFAHVDVAEDGQQGVNAFQSSHYDLILMDVSMPVLDGVGATKEIRSSGSQIPIIAMTANALKGDAERFIGAGMSDYIPKPVDRQLLVSLLVKWLDS
jgi:osomolarity two-component system sensor histidine kinase TcsA